MRSHESGRNGPTHADDRLVRRLPRGAEEGRATLLVATAAADDPVLRFYQRSGFRMLRVERDAFNSTAGYPPIEVDGIPLRARVWLALTLS
jgi:hypothetical protein